MVSSKDVRRIKTASNREMSKLLLTVLREGHRYRMTKSGVMVYGPDGAIATHLTCSDHRAVENFRMNLRHIGITIEKGK